MLTANCTSRFKDKNGVITGYRLEDSRGNNRDITSNQLKQAISQGKIQVKNLKLTADNRLIHLELTPDQKPANKYEALKTFEAKQNLVGKIFDFEVDKETGKIFITKYYDNVNRSSITIPLFVDGFKVYKDAYGDMYGAFSTCKYIKTIHMKSNISGSLNKLFTYFDGNRLNLDDFDTSNVTDMSSMFYNCQAQSLNLGNKFDTHNVTDMRWMFNLCSTPYIDLGNKFDTSNVTDMSHMFYNCQAQSINLGNKFDTSKVKNMKYMFSGCKMQSLNLGKLFNTSNVYDMSYMFFHCSIQSISLGNKFYTSNVFDMPDMFCMCKAQSINLGDKFDISKVQNMKEMFVSCSANKITVGMHVSEDTIQKLKSVTDIPVVVEY